MVGVGRAPAGNVPVDAGPADKEGFTICKGRTAALICLGDFWHARQCPSGCTSRTERSWWPKEKGPTTAPRSTGPRKG